MDATSFAKRYPVLYHMADEAAWPTIRRHGLLSTAAIVDLYRPEPSIAAAILSKVRTESITLHSNALGAVTVRDQLPLRRLQECLHPGVTARQYLDALNGRVYFWVSAARLQKLLNATAYRNRQQLVLHVSTAALLAEYGDSVELAPYNTGNTRWPNSPKRGPDIFVPFADYPFDEWQRKLRRKKEDVVVEFTVPYAVPDISKYVTHVELRHRDNPPVPLELADD
ncbi:DUF7002 family protein [Mycolicibacterium llatzerense]|uniref:DUF7002 family protein n=1 Tax=Mycolicibacterium llatzerense TaxID=280871 RepID=UPI0021B61F78|nr:hypothetical protein [Mycolicibacterium llatzerense]MCT7372094.1 hypothetical protein [Mycolicibacterium llatzerense]